MANCLPKNVHDSKAVDSLALTVLRGRRSAPGNWPRRPNAQGGLAQGATAVIVPPSSSAVGGADTGVSNFIPWQGFDVNSVRPNGAANNWDDWANITNPRPDEFRPKQPEMGYMEFVVPENGMFHIKFQGYLEYRVSSKGEPDTTVSGDPNLLPGPFADDGNDDGNDAVDRKARVGDEGLPEGAENQKPDGDQVYLGLIFTDPGSPFPGVLNFGDNFTPVGPIWNEFFSAPRRIFRETVFTNPNQHAVAYGVKYDVRYPAHLGRLIQCDWVVNCENIRGSPLANLQFPWLWNLNTDRFQPGQKVRCWVVTSSNSEKADNDDVGDFPEESWKNVKFQWKYGGKWYQTGRDYPDIKLEADAVPDNYQTDAPNPPPGRGGPTGYVQGLVSM